MTIDCHCDGLKTRMVEVLDELKQARARITELEGENKKLREMWEYTIQVWEFSMNASPEQYKKWADEVRATLYK